MSAARWAQQQLLHDRLAEQNLRVYAVWFNMYPGDERSAWPATLLTDARVIHFWDEQRGVGRVFLSRLVAMLDRRAPNTLTPAADAMWDAYYLYQRGDRWNDSLPLPVSWGYPIMVTRDQLVAELDRLIATVRQ